MTSIGEKKTETVNAYLIKNSQGEGEEGVGGVRGREKTKQKNVGRGLVGRHSEGLGGVVWVYKIGLK